MYSYIIVFVYDEYFKFYIIQKLKNNSLYNLNSK